MSKYEMLEVIDSGKIIDTNFNEYKNELKIFSEQMEEEIKLPTVEYSGGIFGWGDHKVTGWELNKLTEKIQDHLIVSNNISNKIIKEFETIYNTFNALDNEYIKNIMQSISKSNEAINKANLGLIEAEKRIEDIKETNGKLQVTQQNIKVIQERLQVAQKNIDSNMEIQKKIVEGLSQFKTKIDSYKHLKDVDSMWEDLGKLENKIPLISEDIKEVNGKLQIAQKNIDSNTEIQEKIVEGLSQFKTKIDSYKHLKDVDNMWEDLENKIPLISKDIKEMKKDVDKNIDELNSIKRFKDRLENYRHLEDIDKMWNDLDSLKVIENKLETVENLDRLTNDVEGIKKINSNTELRLKNTFKFIEEQQKKIENLEASQTENQSLSKKINISYFLASGALALTLFNIFYLFLRG